MSRKYKEHLEIFQCKHVDNSVQVDRDKKQAAIHAAERHIEAGKQPMPHVVDAKYRQVYLAEYKRLSALRCE